MPVAELWAWIALGVSMTGLLLWFLLGLLSRGLEFQRLHLETERQATHDELSSELRALDARLAAVERSGVLATPSRPRAVR